MRLTAGPAAVAMLTAAAILGATPPAGPHPPGVPQLERFSWDEPHMGTTFRIVAYASDSAKAGAAAAAAFHSVRRLDSLLSDYRADSEIAALAARAGEGLQPISSELHKVLSSAVEWARRSGGAFDPTVGPLTRLWRWSSGRGELPDEGRLEAARALVGFEGLALSPGPSHLAALARPGMSLDLGGIAKGYAADAALAALARHGVTSAMIDAGGDVVAGAAPPEASGWRIRAPDGSTLLLQNGAVATSGDAHRWLEVGGVRYSHVVDPRTGLGVRNAPTVTVVAGNGATADALASAVTVLGEEAGRELVSGVEGARIVVLEGGGGAIRKGPSAMQAHEGVER